MVLFEKHIHFRDNIVKLKKKLLLIREHMFNNTKTNRKKEWDAYLAVLRETHKKKTRFIQSLRVLTGEKI